jgi:hypothetical protein
MYSAADGDVRWSHNSDEKSKWFYKLFTWDFSTIDPVIYCTQSEATQSTIGRRDGNKLVEVVHIALHNISIHFDDDKYTNPTSSRGIAIDNKTSIGYNA